MMYKTFAWISLGIGVAILSWFAWELYANGFINWNAPLSLVFSSNIGTFIGGVVGIFITVSGILLLFETLSLQRQEFEKSRRIFSQQQFESTFFNMLNIQKDILGQMMYEKETIVRSRELINQIREQINEVYRILSIKDGIDFLNNHGTLRELEYDQYDRKKRINPIFENDNQSGKILSSFPHESTIDKARSSFRIVFNYYSRQLDHYFRNLFQIIKHIQKSEAFAREDDIKMTEEVVKRFKYYADVIQSQMSSSELFILFYYGLCSPQKKELITHYKLIDSLAVEDLIEETHLEFYENVKLSSRKKIAD